MAHGFTYPRTTSDTDKPVTAFKATLATMIRRMADREERTQLTLRKMRDVYKSKWTVAAYRTVADMLDNVIIEGE